MILQNGQTLHLQGKRMSYVMYVSAQKDLLNFHFGGRLPDADYSLDAAQLAEPHQVILSDAKHPYLSFLPQEYPGYGGTDLRCPAFDVVNGFDNAVTRLKFQGSRVLHTGSIEIPGMPSLRGDGEVLEIELADLQIGLEVRLYYVLFAQLDVIARSAVICNRSDKPATLRSACSANVDLPLGSYEMIHFAGDWGEERGMARNALRPGATVEVADNTGRGSRWNNPFVMVAEPDADETHGRVYGFHLIYSGNHATVIEPGVKGHLRVRQGISPRDFAWLLQPGEEFYTPQSVICYSGEGLEGLTHRYHDLYRNHLIPQQWAQNQRPVLLNSWEGCYFNFDEEKLLAMATAAKRAGVELFVLDDGWFGKRDNVHSSLGDWVVHKEKLPGGLERLVQKIHDLGMQFGLWFEPEMVSPDSELYRAHPDWVVRVPQYDPIQYRYQYVLDLSRQEVRDHVVAAVAKVLRNANIQYVKWDMNRIVCDAPYSGFHHRYCLGYYDIMKRLTEGFPQVLFEGCCSGGGRFDPGVLSFMPQIWTSDNTDAVCRLKIQYSTSMCYPLSTMGAHVSAVPNHQTGRITSLQTRAAVAYTGMFGYELDVTRMSREELQQMAKQTEFAKHIQPLIRQGDFYRLRSPFDTNECIWQVVSKEKDHALMVACRVLTGIVRDRHYEPKVRLRGLDAEAVYEDVATGKRYSGSLLMERGLLLHYAFEDFTTVTLEMRKVVS